MSPRATPTRRQFIQSAAATAGALTFLSQLQPVSAAEANLPANLVRLGDDIEPTVRLLEDTPRERLLEEVAARIKSGLSYREVLAALLLAGVRNVQPRPYVGFKFHAVLVINSAHLASLASPDSDRWLPIFWAIDRFKSAQAETMKTSGWRMGEVNPGKLPPARKARQAFMDAMDHWDEDAADAAAAALAQSAGRDECFDLFARYGARDFRDIGHKAIFVANSFRTLETIGWHHAQPVLRSLAYALLQHDGDNPAKTDDPADRSWRTNLDLVKKIQPQWIDGKTSPKATADLLSTFRTANATQAAQAAIDSLNNGASSQSIWDAILSASGELLMRKTGILTLHSVTSANALRFAYESAADEQTRLLLLLQAAAFIPQFRAAANVPDKSDLVRVNEFEPIVPSAAGPDAVAEIFAHAGKDRLTAAKKALAYLNDTHDSATLMHTARRLVFLKGNDAHDYKFSSAVLEDFHHVSPEHRNRYLASALFYFPASTAPDNGLVKRTRAALGA